MNNIREQFKQAIEKFLQNGRYICIENGKDITYMPRETLTKIVLEDDSIYVENVDTSRRIYFGSDVTIVDDNIITRAEEEDDDDD